MLSVRNRGGLVEGVIGVNTSLMMMKTSPELFLRVQVRSGLVDGYSGNARSDGSPTEVIVDNNAGRKLRTAKSFICINGYTPQ